MVLRECLCVTNAFSALESFRTLLGQRTELLSVQTHIMSVEGSEDEELLSV